MGGATVSLRSLSQPLADLSYHAQRMRIIPSSGRASVALAHICVQPVFTRRLQFRTAAATQSRSIGK